MICPICGHDESSVIRTDQQPGAIRRRRECTRCRLRWNTFETTEDTAGELLKIKQLLGPVVELVK